MAQAMCEAIPEAQFCLIVLHNPQTNLLERTAEAGDGAAIRSGQFEAMKKLLTQVFLSGQPESIVAEDGQPAGQLPASLCAVPIESAQAGRLGVLAIGNWECGTAFDGKITICC